jgi:hypothetical protein
MRRTLRNGTSEEAREWVFASLSHAQSWDCYLESLQAGGFGTCFVGVSHAFRSTSAAQERAPQGRSDFRVGL